MDGTRFGHMHLVGKVTGNSQVEKPQKTDCPDINTFAGYLDNQLVTQERDGVEEHMAKCGICRNDLYEIRMLMEEETTPAPENLAENIMKNLQDTTDAPTSGRKIKV